MSYIELISIVALIFGLLDFFLERFEVLQKITYPLAFVTIFFLCAIKYYWGADMIHYFYHYEALTTISDVWHNSSDFIFEPGYSLFCVVLKTLGVSFYQLSLVITIIYFGAIYQLFKDIPSKRSFALMILLALSYELILAQFRQCLSVSFFIFAVLNLKKNRYFLFVLFSFLTVVMHASGIYVIVVLLLFTYLFKIKPSFNTFCFLLLCFLFFAVFPIHSVVSHIADNLPYSQKILHHLMLGKRVQKIVILYGTCFFIISYFKYYENKLSPTSKYAVITIVGMSFIALLYFSFYLVNRIRGYFVPFVIVYIFQLFQLSEKEKIPYYNLLRQIFIVASFVYVGAFIFRQNVMWKKDHLDFFNICTVFELRKYPAHYIQERQKKYAQRWWNDQFVNQLKKNSVEEK